MEVHDHDIAKFFSDLDNTCDKLPIISTISNAVDIIMKGFVEILNSYNPDEVKQNPYFSHIKEKSLGSCITLMIPGVNILVKIHENDKFVNRWKDQKYVLKALKEKPSDIFKVDVSLFKDQFFYPWLIQNHPLAFLLIFNQLEVDANHSELGDKLNEIKAKIVIEGTSKDDELYVIVEGYTYKIPNIKKLTNKIADKLATIISNPISIHSVYTNPEEVEPQVKEYLTTLDKDEITNYFEYGRLSPEQLAVLESIKEKPKRIDWLKPKLFNQSFINHLNSLKSLKNVPVIQKRIESVLKHRINALNRKPSRINQLDPSFLNDKQFIMRLAEKAPLALMLVMENNKIKEILSENLFPDTVVKSQIERVKTNAPDVESDKYKKFNSLQNIYKENVKLDKFSADKMAAIIQDPISIQFIDLQEENLKKEERQYLQSQNNFDINFFLKKSYLSTSQIQLIKDIKVDRKKIFSLSFKLTTDVNWTKFIEYLKENPDLKADKQIKAWLSSVESLKNQ